MYDALAEVYEWLVPDELLAPEGSAAAFADLLEGVPEGGRVLDCAAGTGQLAVGLALRGFALTATDASEAMIGRTRALAAAHGASVRAEVCAWADLPGRGWAGAFDAVLCVGNSLAHAPGRAARRGALAAMAGVLRDDGLLAVTSRTWERVRAAGSRLEVGDRLVERHGRPALVVRAWTIPAGWDDAHGLEVAVALPDAAGRVTTRSEAMLLWPFTREALDEDLRAAGLAPVPARPAPGAERYLVCARRRGIEPPAPG